MKPTPEGWPRISSVVYYEDAAAGIDWLCKAFGFEVRLRLEGESGLIEHSELTYGEGVIMVVNAGDRSGKAVPVPCISPKQASGGNTQTLALYIDDLDTHCEQARAAGATIADEPETTDYGEGYWADRNYRAIDPEGHHWWFMQRMRG